MRKAALLLLCACSTQPRAFAGRVASRAQLIGGPRALGEVGDYRLSNGRVRFIVQDIKGPSRAFGAFGGSLIDADLERPDETLDPRTGLNGADGVGEIFPDFFLSGVDPARLEVLDDGSRGGTARIRVTGAPGEFYTSTSLADLTVLGTGLQFAVDYSLGPLDDALAITASVINPGPGDHGFPNAVAPAPVGLVCLFGEGQRIFMPGEAGYDLRFQLDHAYRRDYKLPALPGLTAGVVAVEGAAVSYGLTYCSSCTSPLDNGLPGFNGYVYNHRDIYGAYAAVDQDSLLVPFVSGSLFGLYAGELPGKLPAGKAFSTTMLLRVSGPSAARQIEGFHGARGDDTGSLGGVAREETTALPVEGAQLVVFDERGGAATSLTTLAGGRFHAALPPGAYRAILRKDGHASSAPLPFAVAAGQQAVLAPLLPRAAALAVEVVDETGRLVPAKITLDADYGAEHAGQEPRTFLYDLRLGDPYRPTDLDASTHRYIEQVIRTPSGRAQAEVRPGHYRATISRGPAYSIWQQEVSLRAGEATVIGAKLVRQVPRRNLVAADLHVHALGSVDSGVPLDERMTSYAVEGIDFLALTEHNFILDPRPTLQRMGLSDFLQASAGIEVSSLEGGHWNSYPLAPLAAPATHGAPAWLGKNPQAVFDAMRALGAHGAAETVVQVNHPRDPAQGYFTTYALTGGALTGDPAHDWPGESGPISPRGPGFGAGAFSLDFDAMEIVTGKRFDLLRTYRVPSPPPPAPIPPACSQTQPPPCTGAPGTIVRDGSGEVAYPGALEDFAHLLDAGKRVTAVANSDSHSLLDGEGGYPRNLIDLGHDIGSARDIDEREVARAIKAGHLTMSNGPQLTVTASGLPPGSVVRPSADGYVHLHVVVEAPDWMEVKTGTLLVSRGPCDETLGDCRAFHLDLQPRPGITRFDEDVAVTFAPGRDGWIALEVRGEKPVWPVVIPLEVPPLLIGDAVKQLAASFGINDPYGNLRPRLVQQVKPWAMSNPMFVDGDGDGKYDPPAPAAKPRRAPLDLREVVRRWR